ncbi:hypothetical protein C1645_811145 [Glomus cerebriforme]|uniref:Uncharacterized protein n=1 Tax=Glomus cerebriforme TaxID=658196 RepID=A0A397TQR5_9GLOM|nr:hypothetical protein C1645_811145 [Glomus cerebriforme]
MTHGTLDANNILIINAHICSKDTPLEYEWIYRKCLYEDPDLRPEVNEVYEILSQLELKINIFTSSLTTQQILEKFKFNYGLILTGCNIQPSNQAIFVKYGELKINLYEGQPVIYTNINELHLGACINFPIVEITYKGDLSESFSKCMDHDEKLNESFGDFSARKFSVEIHFNKLFTLDLLPKITTSNGEEFTYEKLTKWMKDLYRNKMIDIISYGLISISQLRHSTLSVNDLETFNKKHSGVAEYEEKLNLGDWNGN